MIGELALLCAQVVGLIAGLLTLPGTLELLVVSAATLQRRQPEQTASPAGQAAAGRFAVVVPAHDEENGIAACVRSLLDANPGGLAGDIFVVADNCTDQTARLAEAAGARVLVRTDISLRGKGHALEFAFRQLLKEPYEYFLVVDADTRVERNLFLSSSAAFQNGAVAVQARYLASNGQQTNRTRLADLALRAFNVVRPLGRSRLGLSAGIFGNGFGLSRSTLLEIPYIANSLVEDLEYHLLLLKAGRKVVFLNNTTVYGEMPTKAKASESQKARWEGGRFRMLALHAPELLRRVLRGDFRFLEPLGDLLLLPLSFHVTLLLVALAAPVVLCRLLASAGLAVLLLHLGVTILSGKNVRRDLATLALAPPYVLWKVTMLPALLRNARKNQDWVRTERNAEAHALED